MKIFDCHIHCSERSDDVLRSFAARKGFRYDLTELLSMMNDNNVEGGLLLSPPLRNGGIVPNSGTIKLCQKSGGKLFPVLTVEPYKPSVDAVVDLARKYEEYAKAFKILLGYYPIYPNDEIFSQLYDFAETQNIPVMFHTGDTATSNGSLQHSHPRNIDPLANSRPNLKIVLCHFGNPWLLDAAELLYKHPNVYADISGLFSTGAKYSQKYIKFLSKTLSEAIYFIGTADKVLFGSDYPVENIAEAIEFAESLELEKSDIDNILGTNAARLFSR